LVLQRVHLTLGTGGPLEGCLLRSARLSGRRLLAGATFGRRRQLLGMTPFRLGQMDLEGLVFGL
jgi:hypothetical protein